MTWRPLRSSWPPASDPGLVDACGPKGEQSWLCSTVYRITGDSSAADVADALSKPIRIVVVLVVGVDPRADHARVDRGAW